MTKDNHQLAELDDTGNFSLLGSPGTYEDLSKELKALPSGESGSRKRVVLISLRAGIRKRQKVAAAPAKKAAKKK